MHCVGQAFSHDSILMKEEIFIGFLVGAHYLKAKSQSLIRDYSLIKETKN